MTAALAVGGAFLAVGLLAVAVILFHVEHDGCCDAVDEPDDLG